MNINRINFYQFQRGEIEELTPLIDFGQKLAIWPTGYDKSIIEEDIISRNLQSAQSEVERRPDETAMLQREAKDRLMKVTKLRSQTKVSESESKSTQVRLRPGYLAYQRRNVIDEFQQKMEFVFEEKCKCLGDFIYPPGGFRAWHTNKFDTSLDKPISWAIFFIYAKNDNQSFFRYIDPYSNQMVTAWDKKVCVNIFSVSFDPVFWHCIKSQSTIRWSIGFSIPDNWKEILKVS